MSQDADDKSPTILPVTSSASDENAPASSSKPGADSSDKPGTEAAAANPTDQVIDENAPVHFPVDDLQRLDEMLNRIRWVVPVLPKNELETLLDASIALCRQNIDTRSEPCQRFFREGLMISFTKVLTDEAVNTWKYDIYKHIYNNTLKAIELCTLKLLDDWFPLLDLLAMIFNPQCKYHLTNSVRPAELVVKINAGSQSNPSFSRSVTTTLKSGKTRTNRAKTKIYPRNSSKDRQTSKQSELKDEQTQNEETAKTKLEQSSSNEQENSNDKSLNASTGGRRRGGFSSELLVSFKNESDTHTGSGGGKQSDDEDEPDEDDDEYEDISVEENNNDGDDDEDPDDDEADVEEDDEEVDETKQQEKSTEPDTSAPKEGQDEFGSALIKAFNEAQNATEGAAATKKEPAPAKTKTKSSQGSTTTTTYARSYMKSPHGWLVDFINYFGQLNGFKLLLDRFQSQNKLNIQLIAALLKPWGLCYEFLTPYTVRTYFLPIIEIVPKFFENLSDEDIKKECKSESRNDSISTVIKWLKLLATRVQNQEDLCKNLEILRFKTILRILKFASFNGKMNALNEVNKVISNITYSVQLKASSSISCGGSSMVGSSSNYSSHHGKHDSNEEEWLTPDRMAKWIQENEVLDIVLRDCMHQPQYVEKLEKILRFLIKEKALTLKDLDKIWESQLGKHEAIEKNVHDLLSKLAWDFTPEQLDHLFSCFQKSWTVASKKQQEKLLDLIRSLSEDDKEGVMANKVLDLLWNLAHSDDAPTEIIDQAVAAHIKILDYSCSSDKESQKLKCLEKCIEQLKENKWVIVSMRQIREILQQYSEMITGNFQTSRIMNYTTQQQQQAAQSGSAAAAATTTTTTGASSNLLMSGSNLNLINSQSQQPMSSPLSSSIGPAGATTTTTTTTTTSSYFYRHDVIAKLQKEYSLISMITANLNDYYESIRRHVAEHGGGGSGADPETLLPDDRFSHVTQIQERLNFMKYLLKEGHLWLCSAQAETIWKCLAQNSVFECDREICFKWFAKLMTDDPDLEPEMNREFFVNYVTKLDPKLLTDSGIRCFDRFFKNVNLKSNHLVQKRHYFLTENLDLIGLDYLWRIVTFANEEIVEKAILLLKDIYIHLGPQLKSEQSAIHADLISACMDRLKVSYDKLTVIHKSAQSTGDKSSASSKEQDEKDEIISNQEITRILRVMIVLREYLNEFDSNYLCERIFPPLSRASKGKSILLIVRIQVQNRQTEDIEMLTHINETIGSLRRQIYIKAKVNPQVNRIDLIINNECIECVDDNKVLADYQLKEKMFIVARITQTASMLNNSNGGGGGTGAGGNSNPNNTSISGMGGGSGSAGGHASGSGHNRIDSSAESSSDEYGSGSEDSHNVINSPNFESELQLPSVILSLNEQYVQFLIELADFGCKINNIHIKECTRGILDLLPAAKHTSEKIKQFCKDCIVNQEGAARSKQPSSLLDNLYFNCTQTQCWYYLKVTHAMLMPAMSTFNTDETKQFQENFILAGGVTCAKNMLAKDTFLANADDNTKKAAFYYVLKINKLTMTTVCYAIYSFVINAVSTKQFSQITNSQHEHALLLQSSATSIPSNTNEINLRQLSHRLGTQFSTLLVNNLPDIGHITKLERIAWSLAAVGTLNLVAAPQHELIHEALVSGKHSEAIVESSADDINVCREALEDLSLCLCLVPHALETLNQEKHWRTFLVDMVLLSGNRVIRQAASEQFLLIALKCSPQPTRPIQFFIQMLFTCLHTLTKENAPQSQEYFYLLCRLLNCAYLNSVQISNTETLLNNELMWLKKVKQSAVGAAEAGKSSGAASPGGAGGVSAEMAAVDDLLLDGHLSITKELLLFQTAEKKYMIGCHPQGYQLINDLIEYFIFPASYLFKKYRDSFINNSLAITSSSGGGTGAGGVNSALITQQVAQAALNNFEQLLAYKSLKSICSSPLTIISAFDLLVSLCTGCLSNFVFLTDLLFQLFYPSLLPNPVKNLMSASSHHHSTSAASQPAALSSYSDMSTFGSSAAAGGGGGGGGAGSPGLNLLLTNDCTIAQNEWEYIPPIGQRPHNGFVGLKNAGATCYMNSVLQQLFMIKAIRNFILSVDVPTAAATASAATAADSSSRDSGVYSSDTISATTSSTSAAHPTSLFDDLDETDSLTPNQTLLLNSSLNNNNGGGGGDGDKSGGAGDVATRPAAPLSEEEQRKEYNLNIIKNLQMIFGHLAESKMQYYVPKGFWRQFRFGGGERVNLREQHDAVEFFNTLVDYIDEAMKSISREQICSRVLGGVFADQKICKGCPHRYSREESFTLLSVDVKHSSRLTESLEQYVKGDLLEGPNAYHCEKCNKKIDAVKRTCIKKLPMMLAIQLKRFDYDWEREIAVKSNEYFEFPRVLDMEPYTVKGVARIDQQQQQQLMKQQMKSRQADLLAGLSGAGLKDNSNETEGGRGKQNSESEPMAPGGEAEPAPGVGGGVDPTSSLGGADEDEDDDEDLNSQTYSNIYKLVGIVVHSGQANGGHYYSFIRNKTASGGGAGGLGSPSNSSVTATNASASGGAATGGTSGAGGSNNSNDDDSSTSTSENNNSSAGSSNSGDSHWYKFDDGDVSEFKMDEEEMRNQCFGGDYTGEVYDNIVKRMAYKKQKRWWNAYILFYERLPRSDAAAASRTKSEHNASFTSTSVGVVEADSAKSSGVSVGSASLDTTAAKKSLTQMDELAASISSIQLEQPVKMPANILKSVHKKNIKFLHHRHHFSQEYFQFVKKLAQANFGYCQSEQAMSDEGEELCLASVQLAVRFLFSVGFRVKKTLRGPVNDWYEILYSYAKHSYKARQWLARYFLVENSIVIPQYLLDCPSNEIRSTISKMLVALVHLSNTDPPMEVKLSEICSPASSLAVFVAASASQQQLLSASQQAQPIDPNKSRLISVSDSIIQTLLSILGKRDLINEQSSKYLIQFFQFFTIYCSLGIQQCIHLIRSDVPLQFIQFALDELPMTNSNINFNLSSSSSSSSVSLNSYVSAKISNLNQNMNSNGGTSQYADLTKLYCAVSNLLRCFDVSSLCSTLHQAGSQPSSGSVPPNPFSHIHELKLQHQQQQQQLTPSELALLNSSASLKLPAKIEEYVYKRANYVKKLLEDAPNLDETVKLMKFLSWENMAFSTTLLNELLWMAAYHYSYELKPHLEMLYHVLNIGDSWQSRRIAYAFQGVPNEKDGLFDIIARSQNHYQKRAYQIIKMLVQLLTTCELAIDILNKDEELKKKWKASRNWFFNEMEKCRMYNMPNYTYFQSPQSNETSQTYYLERTQSARITLEKAMKIFPPTSSQSASNISKLANSSGSALNASALNTSGNSGNGGGGSGGVGGGEGQQPTPNNPGDNDEPIENEPDEEDEDEDEEEEEGEEEDYESISDDENLHFRLQKIQANTTSGQQQHERKQDEMAGDERSSKDDDKSPVD